MKEVKELFSTNQIALFQHGTATLLYNLFVKLGPVRQLGQKKFYIIGPRILRYRGNYGNMIHYNEPGLSRLGQIRNLVEVDLAFNISVNKYFVHEISGNCQNLEILNLMCCQGKPFIDDDAMSMLKQMKKLRHLNLNYACSLTDAGLSHISGIKSLEKLELVGIAYNKITDIGCIKLVQHLANLKELDLCGNQGIRLPFLRQLEPLGLTRQVPLTINLARTDISIEEICLAARNLGQIKLEMI